MCLLHEGVDCMRVQTVQRGLCVYLCVLHESVDCMRVKTGSEAYVFIPFIA